jgi:predicted regulator of amino acid metabolism with ACT domain
MMNPIFEDVKPLPKVRNNQIIMGYSVIEVNTAEGKRKGQKSK